MKVKKMVEVEIETEIKNINFCCWNNKRECKYLCRGDECFLCGLFNKKLGFNGEVVRCRECLKTFTK
jgi:hypothetical protein